jgi:CxxC motif-containing protein (DUF1111 family)
MAVPLRTRLGQGLVLALALVPAWKSVEPFFRAGPKTVAPEAARLGQELFSHRWTRHDPLSKGDGLGPVFNASSCVECHRQAGAGGGGPVESNVTVYALAKPDPSGRIPQSGVVHQKAVSPSFWETLNLVDSSLPRQSSLPLSLLIERTRRHAQPVSIAQRNTPALFGAGFIDDIDDDAIVSRQRTQAASAQVGGLIGTAGSEIRGRVARLRDGRIGRFGWKLEFATLGEFVKVACANELGLSNPGRPQATPLGMPSYQASGIDLSDEQCDLMTDFIRSLPRPLETPPADAMFTALAKTGKALFSKIGCTDCHAETLGSVRGLYSDLLLHDMGSDLESAEGYRRPVDSEPSVPNEKFKDSEQPSPGEWRTPPLWGVADSAPYLHDGRASTLDAAILVHGGQARSVTERFRNLSSENQQAIIAFLKTLRAPGALATAESPHKIAAR